MTTLIALYQAKEVETFSDLANAVATQLEISSIGTAKLLKTPSVIRDVL